MTSFPLRIVTLDGLYFDSEAEEVVVRTTGGDMGVLAGHINCVSPLGMGRATILSGGKKRYAACIGGMIVVLGGEVKLTPTTFEWAEEIDIPRCRAAVAQAEAVLSDASASPAQRQRAEAHLKRAKVRLGVAASVQDGWQA